jgi:hypothetical protein
MTWAMRKLFAVLVVLLVVGVCGASPEDDGGDRGGNEVAQLG